MPNRTDYLKDLAKHPGSFAVEVQTRLEAPTANAVETQFRKLRNAGLVTVDATSPGARKYSLTEEGKAEVASLVSEDGNRAKLVLEKADSLLEKYTRLGDPQKTQTIAARPHPRVPELRAIERGLSDLPRRELLKVRDSLREQVGDEQTCAKICRLVEAESELCGEKSWWPDTEVIARLEAEIGELKRDLGLEEESQDSSSATDSEA